MFWYVFYKRHLLLLRGIAFFFMGLIVAFIIALNQVSLESLRGNILSMLRDTTNMPIEIDGKISWRFSLRPEIELNDVRIPNADWAKNKSLFWAKKIDVRLDLLSLFKPHPVVRHIKVYDAKIALEKNSKGENSIVYIDKQQIPENTEGEQVSERPLYPVELLPFSGLEIHNVSADIYGKQYLLSGFAMRNYMRDGNIEYSGWVKPYEINFPFVIQFSEYNAERKIYPLRIALATGGEPLIADIALEGKSKAPIDFVVRGEIPDLAKFSQWFNFDIGQFQKISLNVAGGLDRKKITFKKSSVSIYGIGVNFSGLYDWSKKIPVVKAKLSLDELNLYKSFPEWYGVGKEWKRPNRDLNVFHDMPLFGEYLYDIDADLDLYMKRFVVYRSLDLTDMKVKASVKNHHLVADVSTGFADGIINAAIDADIESDGVYNVRAVADGEHIYVGGILSEINIDDVISGLPVNLEFYVEARGKNMSQIMQTITGPIMVYSVDRGFAHADLVEYMYGGDFLTNLRHNVEDIFTGNKRDMIVIDSAIANVKLRDGLIQTQNGVAVESHVVNIRLAGDLDLGKETIQMSLASVPVRGLKLSLSGNLVNAMEISGNLAEPDFKINGAAVAGKVGSAVGIGLLLSPLTGGLSIAGGLVVGLLAGDLIESWLADDEPYKTARKKGAPRRHGDPDWMNKPIKVLIQEFFETRG